jgi:hypothetical protein
MRRPKMPIIITTRIAKQTKTKTKTKPIKTTAIIPTTTTTTTTTTPIRMRTIPTPVTAIGRRVRPQAEEPARVGELAPAEAVSIRTLKPEDVGELEVVVDTVEMVP